MSRLVAVTPFIMTADLKHELLSFQQKQLGNAGENAEKVNFNNCPENTLASTFKFLIYVLNSSERMWILC